MITRSRVRRYREVLGVANAYGIGIKAAGNLLEKIERCRTEETAQIFINEALHRAGRLEYQPHKEPIVLGRAGTILTIGEETITLTFRKKPAAETADAMAVRRAGGLR